MKLIQERDMDELANLIFCNDSPKRIFQFASWNTWLFVTNFSLLFYVEAIKTFDSESNRISLDKTKCKSFSIDMNGRGFKPHVPGGPEHDNNQVLIRVPYESEAQLYTYSRYIRK